MKLKKILLFIVAETTIEQPSREEDACTAQEETRQEEREARGEGAVCAVSGDSVVKVKGLLLLLFKDSVTSCLS